MGAGAATAPPDPTRHAPLLTLTLTPALTPALHRRPRPLRRPDGDYFCDVTITNTGNKALSGIAGAPDGCATALAYQGSTTCQVEVPAKTQALFEDIGTGWPLVLSVNATQGANATGGDTATAVYTPGVAVTVDCPELVSKRECLGAPLGWGLTGLPGRGARARVVRPPGAKLRLSNRL